MSLLEGGNVHFSSVLKSWKSKADHSFIQLERTMKIKIIYICFSDPNKFPWATQLSFTLQHRNSFPSCIIVQYFEWYFVYIFSFLYFPASYLHSINPSKNLLDSLRWRIFATTLFLWSSSIYSLFSHYNSHFSCRTCGFLGWGRTFFPFLNFSRN